MVVQAQADRPQATNIRLDSLADSPGLLPFRLGPTKIISHYHTFLEEIDLEKIDQQIDLIKLQLTDLANRIPNQHFLSFKYIIFHLTNRLNEISTKISTFEPIRVKRGLFNPLGTFIKSISGNLDNNDALRFENALKILQNNENLLSESLSQHISLFKELSLQQSQVLNNISSNQRTLEKAISYIVNVTSTDKDLSIKYMQLSQLFTILSYNIQKLSDEISRIENILAFSRTKSIHHSLLSSKDLKGMLKKLKQLYTSDNILSLDIRYYYDLISLGYYFIEKKIVIVLKFPLVLLPTYDLYRLCPVPNKYSQIILPTLPFMATNSKEFVYMEAECQKVATWYICNHKARIQNKEHRDCVYDLIYQQEIEGTCHPTPISLYKEALLELDSQHYIMSFPKPTKVQLECGQEEHRLLEGSFLATIPHNCYIKSPEFTAYNIENKVLGYAVEITASQKLPESSKSRVRYNFTTIDLNKLHNIQQQIMTESPAKLDTADVSSLYHTTIPVYIIILSGASVLTIIILIQRRRRNIKWNPKLQSNAETKLPSSTNESMTSLEERKAATFAVHVSK